MGKKQRKVHSCSGLKISAAIIAVALFVGSIVLAADAAGQWSIIYNGTRNNRLRFDGYLEIYSSDDIIIYRKEFENVNSVNFTDIPNLGGVFEDIRIEYGVKPHGTLLSPTDSPSTDYWIYAAGNFAVRISASGGVLPIFNIAAVNYVRDDTKLAFGAPPIETPAEYWEGFTVPLNKGIINVAVGQGNASATTTMPLTTGYIDNPGARDIPKNPEVISESGYLVTALDVRQFAAETLTLASVTNEWTFRRGFYQGTSDTEPITSGEDITLPAFTVPDFRDGDIAGVWSSATDNTLFAVTLLPIFTFLAFALVGSFVLFGRKE